jgi:predicted permease
MLRELFSRSLPRTAATGETVLQDLRFGLRTMRRSPVFAMSAIATIALSTAAVGTVASLANTLLWRRLPVEHAEELVSVTATRGRRAGGTVSYPDFATLRNRTTTLSDLAAHYSTAPLFAAVKGDAKEINGAVVSANFFRLLGVHPERGRFFHPDEDRVPDRDRVAVIGHALWHAWFAGSPETVGSPITINGVTFTVIGIAPEGAVALTPQPVEVYIPTMMLRVGYRWCDDALDAGCTTLAMIGRLAPGRTVRDASAEFATLVPAAWAHAREGENSGLDVRQPRGMSEDDQEPRVIATLAAVAVVLLIVCCANLGGLLSAQAAARETEFAVRASLGANRLRVVRQVVTESLLVAAAGGGAGVVLSRAFIDALSRMFYALDDEGHPLYYDFSQTTTIVAGIFTAAIIAGLAFSVIPAIRAVRPDSRLMTTRAVTRRWTTGRWLLSAQAAVAVAMVATAALLTTSARLVLAGQHYNTSHVALMRVRPRLVKYTPERAQRFQREVVRRLQAMPSVESVTMVGVATVLGGGTAKVALTPSSDAHATVHYNEIGPAYFSTLRTPIVAGREFDETDTLRSPRVAVVNETLAARLWPRGRALGAPIAVDNVPHQVVGIVADVSIQARNAAKEAWVYVPFWQNPAEIDSRIAVRLAGDPAAILPALAREVHAVDPDVPIAETIPLSTRMAGLMRPVRVSAVFVGYAASLAMLLTAIGLYGALAFAVSRRTKEIGIRLALGATPGVVVASIAREGLIVVATGAAAGVALAMGLSRLVAHLLYGSATADRLVYSTAALLIVSVGAAASALPARRAASVDPGAALRQE